MKRSFSFAMRSPVVPIPPVLPVGFRFNPSDEELFSYYLEKLLSGLYSDEMPIGIVNFLEFEPWELPGESKVKSDDQVWYFFSKRVVYMESKKRMYKRKTQSGRWSPTGESTVVENLGKINTLRFYKDSPKQPKQITKWLAYEYEIDLPNPGEFVIIKLTNSPVEKRSKRKTNTSKHNLQQCIQKDTVRELDIGIGESSSRATSSHLNHSSVPVYCPTRDSPYIRENQEDCIFASDFENQNLPSKVEDFPTKPTPPTENQYEIPKLPSGNEGIPSQATPHTENQFTPEETNLSCSGTLPEDHLLNQEFNSSLLKSGDFCSQIDLDAEGLEDMDAFYELLNSLNPTIQHATCLDQCM